MNPPPDKGAKFHKCDFQIHTPRDNNWAGPAALVGPANRDAFAAALVQDCRRKGINALAITDHHDLCVWRHVHNAAQAETGPGGAPFPIAERLAVFPGIELTLATPSCQVLLLFDPNLTDEQLSLIWGALRLAPTGPVSDKTTLTQPLHVDLTVNEIANALSDIRTNPEETNPNKFRYLKDRFILLPNVKKGGHKPAIRDGYHSHYKAMPCVGGYIEGCHYHELEQSNRDKIEGKISQWGNRDFGVFQTSDCREVVTKQHAGADVHDFADLGKWPTWVKWAEPSAEALRQACLAKKSRISQTEPVYPLFQIVGVTVSDSTFLGAVELGLNPQFNAFIGGRGTGKSSLLEYVRWTLCDDPLDVGELAHELPNFQRRRKSLIDGTLRPKNGVVSVFYKRNEVIYRIVRSVTDKGDVVTVTDPAGDSKAMPPDQVRREFPIVSYAQKQLSSVGTLPDEINRLVTDPVKAPLAEIQDKIDKTVLPKVKDQRARQLKVSTLDGQLAELTIAIKSKKEQVTALQSKLQALTPEQQAIVAAHDQLSQQHQVLLRAIDLPAKAATIVEQARTQVQALGSIVVADGLPDAAKVKEVAAAANEYIDGVKKQLAAMSKAATENAWLNSDRTAVLSALQVSYEKHQTEYDRCVKESAKNSQQLTEIQSLNRQIAEQEKQQSKLDSERQTVKALLDETGDAPWQEFLQVLQERVELLRNQCKLISDQAENEFKAEALFCADRGPIVAAIERLIEGKHVKGGEEKVSNLADAVCGADHPIEKWVAVLAELSSLLWSKGGTLLPATPLLTAAAFSTANLEQIRNGLTSDVLEQVRFMNLHDQIRFTFKMGQKADGTANYIPFDAASPGQQATCLLRTLLNQSGAPLLIDQPEEDLDNEQIQVLSERIAETKHNRQLLFVSHNANIVVNGDAELVACFDNVDAGDIARGKIEPVGSIDCEPMRHAITAVMEGGRQAFELRKSKYGF